MSDDVIEQRLAKFLNMAHAIDADPVARAAFDAESAAYDHAFTDTGTTDEPAPMVADADAALDIPAHPRSSRVGRWLGRQHQRDLRTELDQVASPPVITRRTTPAGQGHRTRPLGVRTLPQVGALLMIVAATVLSLFGTTSGASHVATLFAFAPVLLVLDIVTERATVARSLVKHVKEQKGSMQIEVLHALQRWHDPEFAYREIASRTETAVAEIASRAEIAEAALAAANASEVLVTGAANEWSVSMRRASSRMGDRVTSAVSATDD
ncbi:hypothetical protein [Nocardia brasiliensis]|uniref:hypothetical protein n=1 Tax=Nocardia brasiliensis TaxID=37326 RepID=UPI003D8F870E